MPNCEQLIIDIQETIRENGNNEITGPILQDVLVDMVYALCGEQQSFDELTMWSLLSKATPEQINVSHLSATDVAGMLSKAGYKLTDTTYALATDEVAGLLKTGYAENGKNYAVKLDDTGAAYVTVNWQDKFDTYFGVDGDGNIYVKGNRGLWSNSFLSARGSDPEAGSGGSGGGLDEQAMWYALGQPTSEKINASHIPALPISQITGLQSALNSKLESITKPMVEEVLTGTITSHNHDGRYAPLSGGLIPSQYLPSYVDDVLEYASKTAFPATGEAGKIYVATDTNLTYRWGGSAYVEISPSLALGYTSSTAYPGDEGAALAALVEGMKEITDLFGIDEDGNVYVKDGKGFYGTSFVSARGSDPLAGSSGAGGLDIDAMWEALAESGTQKINASHIPLLQQLSGTLTNAQLANSSLSIAGVEVPLGGSVSAEQIASALGLGSNAYTSTAYLPLAGGTMSGTLTFPTATEAYNSLGVRFSGVSSRIGVDAAGGLGLYAQDAIYLRPSWTSGGTLYGLIIRASDLTYNGNPLLHSGNYTNYTVTKTGGGASGTWGISISGLANRAGYLTSTYTGSGGLQPPSYFNGMGLKVNMMNKPVSYCDVIVVNGYSGIGSDVPYINALAFQKTANAHGEVYHARGDYGGSSWGTWYKFLDEYNYAGILDSRYVKKSGDTMTGALKVSANAEPLAEFIRTNTSEPYIAIGNSSGRRAALTYHPTYKACIYNYVGNDYMGLLDDGTPHVNGNKIWYSGNDGAGSGLDADLLDGYQATSFQFAVSHNYELSLSGGIRGKYVILLHPDTLSSANYSLPVGYSVQGTFHLFRPIGNGTASIIVKSGAGYSSTWNSGSIIAMPDNNCFPSMKLVTCNYGGKLYRALFVDAVQDIIHLYFRGVVMNRDTNFGLAVKFYDYGTGEVTNAEVNGSFADFQYYHAISCPQGIRGNASSATKLATARSLWGQSFDGNGNVNGHIYLDSQSHRIYFGTSGTTPYLSAGDGYFTINRATNTNYAANLLRINLSNGAVGINAVPSAMLHVGGTGYFSSNLEVSGTIHSSVGIWSNGYVSAKGQDTTSDARYKRDVSALPAQAALAVLMRLRPSTWAWKDDGRRGAGFVAQEVLGVLPEAVREVGDGEDRHLALNYQMLHAYEVCLLQTHETELERLRGRVNQLENEIKRKDKCNA